MTQPALINFYPIQYNQQLSYYPYSVNLDRCVGHCNTFSDLSNRTYIRKKTKDLSLHYFNVVTAENESKTLTVHISSPCKSSLKVKNKT